MLGVRQFSLRGEAAAAGEWCLVCLAYNLKRLHRLTSGRLISVMLNQATLVLSAPMRRRIGPKRPADAVSGVHPGENSPRRTPDTALATDRQSRQAVPTINEARLRWVGQNIPTRTTLSDSPPAGSERGRNNLRVRTHRHHRLFQSACSDRLGRRNGLENLHRPTLRSQYRSDDPDCQ